MPDYREIYLIMARETEKAINILIDAQKRCEELYISAEDPKIERLFPTGKGADDTNDS